MPTIHYYRLPAAIATQPVQPVESKFLPATFSVQKETAFHIEVSAALSSDSLKKLSWLLSETFEPSSTRPEESFLFKTADTPGHLLEFGPRKAFESPFSSNAKTICKQCGIPGVDRVEKCRRYLILCNDGTATNKTLTSDQLKFFKDNVHDRMTEMEYPTDTPIETFVEKDPVIPSVEFIKIMEEGREALEKVNAEQGLGFDDFDLGFYTELFREKLGRNPSNVEAFDMGQSNSEHSRHWFFGGKQIIDGEEMPDTLFSMVKDTIREGVSKTNQNSVIAFHDNSSAIRGYDNVEVLKPTVVGSPSSMQTSKTTLHPILTAETHNFPCGVAPYPGAETGTGGRLRDVMATGRGAHSLAGISSYCVGNLNIPNYELEWEDKSFEYPSNLASPLEIEVEASNGASDYGNKYGEPVIHGFTRSFGQRLPNGERFEWVKPIMFSAGIGTMDGKHGVKGDPAKGMLVVKIGGPAYRIGVGGGAASSKAGGEDASNSKLDFDAVQRGDAEMENRMNRLMRGCIELGDKNPIVSVHDQGAGGNGNVLKEIVEPAGAEYDIRKVYVGDDTLSVLEIWGAEYQENNALLINPEDEEIFRKIADRENCPMRILGTVTGDGKVVVKDSQATGPQSTPVDLPLELVLGKMPQKTFTDNRNKPNFTPLDLPSDITPMTALDRVLRLLSVGSKRFLVHKVDRSVSGLIAQQPCVGPLQIPLANLGMTAHSYYGKTGTVVACGEQPIKGLIDAAAMARMTVAEAMTNIVWAKLSAIEDIKASGNWMYAAKLPGEGAKMWDACKALRDCLLELGVGIDGGKDSLSMAAKCGDEVVKSPGELTLTCYCTSPDVLLSVTPDLKPSSGSRLIYVSLNDPSKQRLGGTALAQVYSQVGDTVPDIENFGVLKSGMSVIQDLIGSKKILAGHDRSDGGLATTLLEMAFSGDCGIDVNIPSNGGGAIEVLFNEEAGVVLQVAGGDSKEIVELFGAANVTAFDIGSLTTDKSCKIAVDSALAITGDCASLRDIWEATSFELEKLQRNPVLVQQEQDNLCKRKAPAWSLSFSPAPTPSSLMDSSSKPKVAILRQEGTNGDREMAAAFLAAGFEPWDVTVADLVEGRITLDGFRGLAACGGFSFADTLDSAKGWAGVIRYNENVLKQFEQFRNREDTFMLGVCNGCQLFALLGWVGESKTGGEEKNTRLVHNDSGMFESRFTSVQIQEDNNSLFFSGMGGSSLGIVVCHGEGKFHFPDKSVHESVLTNGNACVRYVNDDNEITTDYPFNPNGSPDGIAALSSDDGRVLAIMPHPERVFMEFQWPWMSEKIKGEGNVGPWIQMFQNARAFCDKC